MVAIGAPSDAPCHAPRAEETAAKHRRAAERAEGGTSKAKVEAHRKERDLESALRKAESDIDALKQEVKRERGWAGGS